MCASAFANEARVFHAAGASPRLSLGAAKEEDKQNVCEALSGDFRANLVLATSHPFK